MSKTIKTPTTVTLKTSSKEMLMFLKQWMEAQEVAYIEVFKDVPEGDPDESRIEPCLIMYEDLAA